MKINISQNIKRMIAACTLLFLIIFIYFPELRTPKDTYHSGEYLVDMDDMVKKDALLLIKDIVQLKFPYTIESITSYLKVKEFSVEEYPVPGVYYTYPKDSSDFLTRVVIRPENLNFTFKTCVSDNDIISSFGKNGRSSGIVTSHAPRNSRTNIIISYDISKRVYEFDNTRIKSNEVCFTTLKIYSYNLEGK